MIELSASNITFYILLGICSGIFSATFGLGGGLIVVPALTIMAAMPQKNAQGVALVVMIPMAVMGALRYYWNPNIHLDVRVISIMAVTVVIGANIGAEIVGRVSNRTLQLGFGIILLLVSVQYIWKALFFDPSVK